MPLTSVLDPQALPANADRVTRAEIIARWLRTSGLGITGTATNGDDTSIIDTVRLRSGRYDPEDYEGAWVRISVTDGNNAAPAGEIRPIERFLPSEGRFEVSPRFSAPVATGHTYQVFRYPDPQEVLDHLDDVLTNTGKFPHIAFATDLPDGDMEAANMDSWTLSLSMDPTSTEKRKTSVDRLPFTGKRYLATNLAGGETSGFVESAIMGVNPGMTLHCSSLVQTNNHPGAVAKLVIWDQTNEVELDSAQVTQQISMARLRIQHQTIIPGQTRAVTVRLVNEQTLGQVGPVRFDEVVFYALGSRDIYLPSWVRRPNQVIRIYRHVDSGGYEKSVGNVLVPDTMFGYDTPDWVPQDEAFGNGYTKLVSHTTVTSEPLFIIGLRHEESFVDDLEVKNINIEYVLAKLMTQVYDALANIPNAGSYNIAQISQQARVAEEKARRHELWQAQHIIRGLPRQGVSLTNGRPLGSGAARVITR
jgi:hypothetical protein